MNANNKNNLKSPADSQGAVLNVKKPEVRDIPLEKIRENKFWHRSNAEGDFGLISHILLISGIIPNKFRSYLMQGQNIFECVCVYLTTKVGNAFWEFYYGKFKFNSRSSEFGRFCT